MYRAARKSTISTGSVPAPIGGLNARDSIANMKPTDAILMDNWVPGTTSVSIRKGYVGHVPGFADPVETLMGYRAATQGNLFAAAGTSIYDVTAAGALGAPVVTGLTSAQFQHANFGTPGGQFLYAVNGADEPQLWDGTTWTAIDGSSTPAITGVTTTLLKDVQVYARRLWFVEKDSFRVWYLPVDSIAGAASEIDFAPLFVLGGSLQGMVVWTVASELSTTSYAAFVSSEGEVLLYTGLNPDDPDAFNLAGSFRIGKPIGQRFYERVGSDTVLITQDGLIPMSKAAIFNRQNQSDAISFKIQNLLNVDIQTWGAVSGWQVILHPLENKIILNSPRTSRNETVQYVMNTLTNQWCRYVNISARCWELFEDNIYFGGETAVYHGEYGADDDGAGIAADIMPAYSYFGAPGLQKLFTAVRPIITSNGNFQPSIGLAFDFGAAIPASDPTLSLGNPEALWDVSPWDVTAWGDGIKTSRDWQWIGGIGFAASLRMQSLTKFMAVEWQSTDYAWEKSRGGLF